MMDEVSKSQRKQVRKNYILALSRPSMTIANFFPQLTLEKSFVRISPIVEIL